MTLFFSPRFLDWFSSHWRSSYRIHSDVTTRPRRTTRCLLFGQQLLLKQVVVTKFTDSKSGSKIFGAKTPILQVLRCSNPIFLAQPHPKPPNPIFFLLKHMVKRTLFEPNFRPPSPSLQSLLFQGPAASPSVGFQRPWATACRCCPLRGQRGQRGHLRGPVGGVRGPRPCCSAGYCPGVELGKLGNMTCLHGLRIKNWKQLDLST